MSDFVHLHLHTEYSLLDGATRIDTLFKRCAELGMPAVAITDHGNMYGAYHFYCKANEIDKKTKERKYNIKPIIGCEFYIVDDMKVKVGRDKSADFEGGRNHLILLAKNNIGYKNLVKLNSIAFVDGFYIKPRIDFETLKQHDEGLICLSACIVGELPKALLRGMYDEADRIVEKYKALFKDDYYIEIQDHGIAEERYVLPKLIDIANKHGVELVATNDVHYLKQEDSEAHDILLCVQTSSYIDDPDRMKFTGKEFYLKSGEEMEKLFAYIPRAIANTKVIADKCDVQIVKEKLLPNYVPPDNMTPAEYLYKIMYEGLRAKYGNLTKEIIDRAEYEYGIIKQMGYVEYYLIVWDFVHYAEVHNIPVGPGRGSGAGSIIAYAIGITKVEPLRFHLIFERFLNPERVSMPDFDIDFCMDRRGEVIQYVNEKYGEGKVAQIVTFGTMAAKNAIKDVCRVLRIPYSEGDKITKLIPNTPKITLRNVLGMDKSEKGEDWSVPEIIEIYNNPDEYQMRRVIDIALQLEGSPRQTGMHAAGVVICRELISDHVPLQRSGDDITTQYNMKEVEQLGLLKIDFLGLRTLTDIDKAIKYVYQNTGELIDFNKSDYDDAKVFEMISRGDTDAVFQLESPGMKKLMRDLQPNRLEEIIAGISLFRPGPMAFIPDYIAGKRDPEHIKYKHPLLEPILKTTYGCMVYQEQIMQIVRDLSGYSYGQSDIIRRAMSKKDMAEMKRQREIFLHGELDKNGKVIIEGAVSRGVPEDVANDVFSQMITFAEYAFNKSHAAGYAFIAYQTAYLKCYHFVEYLAAVLNDRIDNIDDIKKYTGYAMSQGIEVLPPDINESEAGFSATKDGKLRFGLAGIKSIGVGAIEKLISERKANGNFVSLADFIKRADSGVLNKRLVENLIKAGAFDCFGMKRVEMMSCYDVLMSRLAEDKKKRESGQFSMFELLGEDTSFQEVDYSGLTEYSHKVKLEMEKEVLGLYVSGSLLDEYKEQLAQYNFNSAQLQVDANDEDALMVMQNQYDGTKVVCGGMIREIEKRMTKTNQSMATAKLEDLYGSIDLVIFPRAYDKIKDKLSPDIMVTVTGNINAKEEKPKIFVEKIDLWNNKQEETEQQAKEAKQLQPQKALCLKMDVKDDAKYQQVKNILLQYSGDCPVFLFIDGKCYPMAEKVRECGGLEYELTGVLSNDNVKFLDK